MVAPNKRLTTPWSGKCVPALRVEPEKVPLGVIRCLFSLTKRRASCLDWHFFRLNRGENETSTDPSGNENEYIKEGSRKHRERNANTR